jgi:RND family efflux transporter MFP subunit
MHAVITLLLTLILFEFSPGAAAASDYTVKTLEQVATYPQSRAVAQVVPENESRIAAEVNARIQQIPVQVGQPVRKGEVLVRLDRTQYQLGLEQAGSQVELLQNRFKLAQLQFEQARSLHESNFISAQALEQRRTELAVLESELKIARTAVSQAQLALQRTTLRAPFSGAVKERLAGEGELASPGQPLLTLVELGKTEIRARIPTQELASLQKAKEPVFRQDAQSHPVTIVRIAPLVDARAQTREVVLRSKQALLSGSSGELVWSSSMPYLPAAYILQHQRQLGVWIEAGGKPAFKPLPSAQAGRPIAVDWPLSTRIVDEGRFALGGPAVAPNASDTR